MKRMIWLLAAVWILGVTGCSVSRVPGEKLRDLEYTRVEEGEIPEEVMALIREKKTRPFLFSWADGDDLYIARGYGGQETDGYEIRIDGLYETEAVLVLETTLLGPEPDAQTQEKKSYPYLVIRTEYNSKFVMTE